MDRYIHSRFYRGGFAALAVIVAVGLFACEQRRQGDRCNPALVQPGGPTPQYSEDECAGSGLSCQTPPTCAISVCCPSFPADTSKLDAAAYDPSCACFITGAPCACAVPSLILDAGSGDAGSSDDGGTNDAGGIDAGSIDAAKDAAPPIDAPNDAGAGTG